MIRALYTAASGILLRELNLDNIANNLSNSSTAGFRSRRLQFEDLIYQNLIMPGAAATQQTTVVARTAGGFGHALRRLGSNPVAGRLQPDGNPLDLTIQGQGFFSGAFAQWTDCLYPGGKLSYRRARQPGRPGMATRCSPGSLFDGRDFDHGGFRWTVSVTLAGQTAAQQVGSLQLALFNNPGGLNSTAAICFSRPRRRAIPWSGTPGAAKGLGSIVQAAGAVERQRSHRIREYDVAQRII